MAETFSFAEGTALFVTGGATATVAYARDIQGAMNVGWFSYRPPFSTTRAYIETGREATVSIGHVHSQKDLATMLAGATAGGVHVGIIHAAAGVTSTIWLYSGVISNYSINGSDGDVMMRNVQGTFQTWSET